MMATSVGAAAAQGLESGFGMGMRINQQQIEQDRAAEQSKRADEQLGLQRDTQARLEARQNTEFERAEAERQRQVTNDQYKALNDEETELVKSSAAFAQAGTPVPPDISARYSAVKRAKAEHRSTVIAPRLAKERQGAVDALTKLQSGELSPESLGPAGFYRTISLATGRQPEEIAAAAQGAQLVAQGHQTGNKEQVLQGVNALVAPELRTGIGEPSPHGGTIARKEVIGLIPVKDANGVEHPDKVFPLIRVYVQRDAGQQGPDMQGGGFGYYDAPLTENRSSDPNDKVKAIDLAHAFDYMGRMGALAAALQHPEAQALLAEGAKQVGAETKADLDEFHTLGKSAVINSTKNTDAQFLALLDRRVASGEMTRAEADEAASVRLKIKAAPKAPTGLGATFGAIDARTDLTPEQRSEQKTVATPGQAAIVTTGMRTKSAAELNAARIAAKGLGTGGKGVAGGTGKMAPGSKYDKDPEYARAIDHWAQVIAKGGAMPPGTGRDKDFVRDVNLRVPAYSGSAGEQLANASEYGGIKAGSRAAGTRAANFELAKSEAYSMADLVTQASAKFTRTQFAPINSAIASYEKNTGDPTIREFGAALNSFINAYARAVSPVGAPTVSDKNHAREMLSTADSHQQVQAIIAQLKKEMVAAGKAPEDVRAIQRNAATGGLGLTGPASRAPAASSADDDLINKYLKK